MHAARPARPAMLALALLLQLGCDGGGDLEAGEAGAESTETGDACPVGSEDCDCTEGGSCDEGLACSAELVCEPVPACPVGSEGCACTEGGSCDEGLACLEQEGEAEPVCGCPPGEIGCACLEDSSCSDTLDCVEGSCEVPGLPVDGEDGWTDQTCWAAPGNDEKAFCTAMRGDVVVYVLSACEVASKLASGEWTRSAVWGESWCAAGEAIDSTSWDDALCVAETGNCMARLGGMWAQIYPECNAPTQSDHDPWGPDYCTAEPPPPSSDFDEWRCNDVGCMARRGSVWVSPLPLCTVEQQFSEEMVPMAC